MSSANFIKVKLLATLYKRSLEKLILFIDMPRQHHRSIMVREHKNQNKDVLQIIDFPKGSSELMPLKNAGDRENLIYWYRNTIQSL